MTIELSNLTFTNQADVVPVSGVEQILNTGVANTLAGNDRITGTGNDYGFKNLGTLNTDDGNDTITGFATSSGGTGITIGFGKTLDTGKGDDQISGTGYLNNGFVNEGTFSTSDGNDKISGSGLISGFINAGTGTFNTGDGDDQIVGSGNNYGFVNVGAFSTDDGDDTITGLSRREGIINDSGSILDTGNGNDILSGNGFIGIRNDGTIITGNGKDSLISSGIFINRGVVFLEDGNDSIANFNSNFENFNFIETGDGDDIISTRAIYNEGIINTGNGDDSIIANGGIYNNGGSINTGDGNDDFIITNGGFQSGLNNSGSVFLGDGDDHLKGFGNGDFYGGYGRDILELTPGTYTVGIWDTTGIWDRTVTFTNSSNVRMITSEFEQLIAGSAMYHIDSLTAGQIITVA